MLSSTIFQVYPELLPEETKAREDGKVSSVSSASAFPRHHYRDRNQHPCNYDHDHHPRHPLVIISDDDHDAQVQYFSGPVFSQMVPMMLKVLKFFGGSPQSR